MKKLAIILSLLMVVLTACEQIHKLGLGNRVKRMMGQDAPDMDEPKEPVPKKNVHCCYCKEFPEMTNVLLHAASTDDCSGKIKLGTFKSCKKVVLIEGDCSLLEISHAPGGFKCEGIPRFYMENGEKIEITPPSIKEGACNPSTGAMVEDFQNSIDYESDANDETPEQRRERRRRIRAGQQ